MNGQEFLVSGIFVGGDNRCEKTGSIPDAFPGADFGLCSSQHISIEVRWNGCLSRMVLHLVAELKEAS